MFGEKLPHRRQRDQDLDQLNINLFEATIHKPATNLRLAAGKSVTACTAWDGVAAARIAEATTLSRLEHRPVRLDEIMG